MGIARLIAATWLTIAAVPAQAAWLRAESEHFIVYSDDREAAVRDLATELETFDAALRRVHASPVRDGTASNKLTVFVLDDIGAVQRLYGGGNVAGFYQGRAAGSVAFTPRYAMVESRNDMRPRNVLFHEYAHHFMFANFESAFPAWLAEGYAEFMSTFQRGKDGWIVGAAANHRAQGLFSAERMPAALLFDHNTRRLTEGQRELVYGRGWLLTHYLMFTPGMRDKLDAYLKAVNAGTPGVAAATAAFGPLKALDRTLDAYLRAKTITAMTIRPENLKVGPIAVRALSPGEAAMIEHRIVSTRGVNSKTAAPLLARAGKLAARHPDDPVVQGWLAEMAFDAADLSAADAAADRALLRDPKSAQALLYKGLIALRRAEESKADAAAYAAARKYIVRANKLDPDNAMPLYAFYTSYEIEDRPPTKNAADGLLRAQQLAPQDDGLRYAATRQLIREGELVAARQLLRPLAYSPHGGGPEGAAARLLAALDTAGADAGAAQRALDAIEKPATPTTPKS